MQCPTREELAAMAPLSAHKVEQVCTACEITGTDAEKYEQWSARFNSTPPAPVGGFTPSFEGWIAANYAP